MSSHVINGVAIYGDARLDRDQIVGSEMGIWMHPLEVIAWKYRKEPHARLDAVLEWITARIDHQVRIATLRLTTHSDDPAQTKGSQA